MTLKIGRCAAGTALTFIVFAGCILSSSPSDAQIVRAKAGRCSSYDPRPQCTNDYRNAKRKQFGLPTLEKIRQLNGYAGPKSELIVATVSLKTRGGIALVLQRDRKGMPTIEIRQMLRRDRSARPKPISVTIPETTWSVIVAKGMALNPVYATDEVLVCGATFTVELVDEKGNIHAPVGDSCGNEPRGSFFQALAEAALAQLPHCAALYPDGYDATLDRLTSCFALGGNEMAAAELFNELERGDFWRSLGQGGLSEIRPLFEDEITFSWPGIPVIKDAGTAAEFWAGDWLYAVDLQYDSFHGETADRVRVEGSVMAERPEGEGEIQSRAGPFTAIWQRGADGKFRMHRFEHSGTSGR